MPGRARARRCANASGERADMRAIGPVAAVLIALLLVASSVLFTVDQRQNAIVFQLGEVKEVITTPGLQFKWPLIQNVRVFDMRILDLRRRRAAALPHLGQPPGAGGFVRQVAHRRRQAVLRFGAGRRDRSDAAPAPDHFGRAARRVRRAHRARRGLGRARDGDGQGAREGRPGPAPHRRRDRRRAPEARRPAAGSERVGVPPHGGREQAHRQRAALHRRRRVRARSARTPTASAR